MKVTTFLSKSGKVIVSLLALIRTVKLAIIVMIIFILLIILYVGIKLAKKRMTRYRAANTSTSHSGENIEIDLHISIR